MSEKTAAFNHPDERGLSRRDFFRTSSLAAGGAVLLSLPNFISGWADTAEAAIATGQPFNHLALELEG